MKHHLSPEWRRALQSILVSTYTIYDNVLLYSIGVLVDVVMNFYTAFSIQVLS